MKDNKIVFILPSLSVGGAEKRAATIANYLVENGFEIEIVFLDNPIKRFKLDKRIKTVFLTDSNNLNLETDLSTEIVYTKIKSITLLEKFKLKIYKYFYKKMYSAFNQLLYFKQRYSNKIFDYLKDKPNCIVISWMTEINISACYALRKLKNQVVIVECTSPYDEYSKEHFMNKLKKQQYVRAQKCICQTDKSAAFYTYLTNTKKYVIPNPIIGDYPERFTGVRKKVIVNYCRLSKVKNIPLLIDAFQMLHKNYPEYELHIFGDGPEKDRLFLYANELGLSESVIFFDFDVNLHQRIIDYSMFVSSSDREGMSNSMLEAMAIGLPTIVTNTSSGAAEMLIENYVNGIIVPTNDKNALYEAMKYIVDNPQKADEISIKATKISKSLSMNKIGEKWIKAILE